MSPKSSKAVGNFDVHGTEAEFWVSLMFSPKSCGPWNTLDCATTCGVSPKLISPNAGCLIMTNFEVAFGVSSKLPPPIVGFLDMSGCETAFKV